MSYKITCNRLGCQHCHKHHCTAPNIEIDDNGQCLSLKKSIVYYIGLVWRALKHSNFIIVFPSFSDELRYGLYVVMSMYDLTFSTDEVRGLITLYQGENGPLNAAEIVDLPVNNEKFSEIVADFNENGPIVLKNPTHHNQNQNLNHGDGLHRMVYSQKPIGETTKK